MKKEQIDQVERKRDRIMARRAIRQFSEAIKPIAEKQELIRRSYKQTKRLKENPRRNRFG